MSNAERKLSELFAADVPPATDHAFTFAVLERIERRRALLSVLEAVPFAIAGAALLWLLAPSIDEVLQQSLTVLTAPVFAGTVVVTLTAVALGAGGSLREVWETAFD